MKKLVPSDKLFSTILSNVEDAVIATSMHGDVVFLNKAAEQLTGWHASSAIDNSVDAVFTIAKVETKEALENPVRTVLKSGTVNNSAILIRKDKSELRIEYRVAPINDHAGNIEGVVLIFQDKTHQNKVDEELNAIKKELEAYSHTISHDMRAPLRAIKGYATILEEDYATLLGKEGRSVLEIINKNALRMDTLIDDLLKFSKLGKQKVVWHEIDVRKEVNTILNDLLVSTQRHAEIILHDLPPMLADHNMFVQVWTNLLSNAIKFTAKVEKPKIEIGCQKGETEVIYYIQDNGAGFDMKYADQLFGVFQRLHKASEFEGSGVGLSIVQRIISKHGGRVWGEGEVNAGATFYFAIPKKSPSE